MHKGLLMTKSIKFLIALLSLFAAFLVGTYEGARDYALLEAAAKPAIDCNKVQPKILTKSSVDGKTYLVDICSIVDSAAGEDFRTLVEAK